jgi:transcriptional regulator with XRE-family HTH domain
MIKIKSTLHAEEFKHRRVLLNKTHDELASELGVTTRQIYRYESGENPIPKVVELLLDRLGAKED